MLRNLGIGFDSRVPLASHDEEPEIEAETAAELAMNDKDVVATELKDFLRRSIEAEVQHRSMAMTRFEQCCEELHSALAADREHTKTQLNAENAARRACVDALAKRLNSLAQQIESSSPCSSPNGDHEQPPLAVRDASVTAGNISADTQASHGDWVLHLRCGQLEVELADTKHRLVEEVRARENLADEVERIREEFTNAAHSKLCTALAKENEQRSASFSRLESEISRVGEEVDRLEKEVVRSGFEALEFRLDEVAQAVPASTTNSPQPRTCEEPPHQDEHGMRNAIQVLETRLNELTTSLRDEFCSQEKQRASNFALGCWEDATPSGDESGGSMPPLNMRITQLARVLREEVRRQDDLDVRMSQIEAGFKEGQTRAEKLAEGLRDEFRKGDELAELMRDDALQSGLQEQEVTFTNLIAEVRKEQHLLQNIVIPALRDEVHMEIMEQNTKISEVRDLVMSCSEREKDLWHAIDTHTHDLSLKHQTAAAAAATAAAGSAGREPSAARVVTTPAPVQAGTPVKSVQRWSTPISRRSTVASPVRHCSVERRNSVPTPHAPSTAVLRGTSVPLLPSPAHGAPPLTFVPPVAANVLPGASITRSATLSPVRLRETSVGTPITPAMAGAAAASVGAPISSTRVGAGIIVPTSSRSTTALPQLIAQNSCHDAKMRSECDWNALGV